MRTWLTERLGIELPIVAAPMARISGGRLAGAVSAAGGLGMIGVSPGATAAWVSEQSDVARTEAAGRPFGIGLLAWALEEDPQPMTAVLESGAALVALSFGTYTSFVAPLHEAGMLVATQAGTLAEARAAVQAGVDEANAKLARVEGIKKFVIVEGDWAPGGDEITPTMKLKRKPIAGKYAAQIEEMYAAS